MLSLVDKSEAQVVSIVGGGRCASEASLALRWRDTRQATRLLESQEGGGLGETSPKRVRAVARSRGDNVVLSSLPPCVRAANAEKGLELLAGFFLGGDGT